MLKFIKKLINYITKMVIGNGIEMMMRKILFTWLQSASTDPNDFTKINNTIENILERELTGIDNYGIEKTMKSVLYNDVCPSLVKNIAEIFKDREEEHAHNIQSTREILLNYFMLLSDLAYWGNKIPEEVMNIFRINVVNYFDTIASKAILLWYVNVENILKYFINNHRSIKTLKALVKN
jgi:hypothetical protein